MYIRGERARSVLELLTGVQNGRPSLGFRMRSLTLIPWLKLHKRRRQRTLIVETHLADQCPKVTSHTDL